MRSALHDAKTRFGGPRAPPAGDVVHRVEAIVQSTSDAPVTAPLVPIARAMGRAGSAKAAFVDRPVKSGDFHDLERLPSISLLRGPPSRGHVDRAALPPHSDVDVVSRSCGIRMSASPRSHFARKVEVLLWAATSSIDFCDTATKPGHTARLPRTSRAGRSLARPSAFRLAAVGSACEAVRATRDTLAGAPVGRRTPSRGIAVALWPKPEGICAIEPQLDIARAPVVTGAHVQKLGGLPSISRRPEIHVPTSPREERGRFGEPGCFPS